MKIKTVSETGVYPEYKTERSAGFDLRANLENPIKIHKKNNVVMIPTGLYMEIPKGYEGQIRPRSGLAANKGVSVVNTPGTIDSDYRGEIKVALINFGKDNVIIYPGDRIAQMVISPVIQVEFEPTEDLSKTGRGEGGFGSTGNK